MKKGNKIHGSACGSQRNVAPMPSKASNAKAGRVTKMGAVPEGSSRKNISRGEKHTVRDDAGQYRGT